MFTPCFGCPSSGWEQITTLGQGAVFVQDILMHLTLLPRDQALPFCCTADSVPTNFRRANSTPARKPTARPGYWTNLLLLGMLLFGVLFIRSA